VAVRNNALTTDPNVALDPNQTIEHTTEGEVIISLEQGNTPNDGNLIGLEL
jgi:hypothetical protein